jgi:hypothetical protein
LEVADLVGKGASNVKAEKAEGLDKSSPQSGVLKPLREADLTE